MGSHSNGVPGSKERAFRTRTEVARQSNKAGEDNTLDGTERDCKGLEMDRKDRWVSSEDSRRSHCEAKRAHMALLEGWRGNLGTGFGFFALGMSLCVCILASFSTNSMYQSKSAENHET